MGIERRLVDVDLVEEDLGRVFLVGAHLEGEAARFVPHAVCGVLLELSGERADVSLLDL